MKYLNFKTLTSGIAAVLLMSGVFANQALAAGGGGITVPPAKVVVAKSGGNYTTIAAALNAITPTATNPYVIEVWPGVYTENVVLKSNVHLKGSGRDVTTVKAATGVVISDIGLTNVTISGLTITGGGNGISIESTTTSPNSVTIYDNTISNNAAYGIAGRGNSTYLNSAVITGNKVIGNGQTGLDLAWTSATVIGNLISDNGYAGCTGTGTCMAIFIDGRGTETQVITGNVITGNNAVGIAIWNNTNATVSNNVITDNTLGGVNINVATSGGSVTNNKIVNNGGTLYTDIVVGQVGTLTPNISFNIFDDITGDRGVGSYNVNSNGNPILVP